jgi:hypothetical protein
VAGPCGNFTRFPILLLPENQQQAPEAKTVMLRRRPIYTELHMKEMLRCGFYENYSSVARSGLRYRLLDWIFKAIVKTKRTYTSLQVHTRERFGTKANSQL